MKTIEERAKVYAGTKCSNIQSEFHRKLLVDAFVSSYIKGAEEQRKIDKEVVEKTKEEMINKAMKAFDESCGWLYIYPWYQEVLDQFIETIKK